MIEYSIGVELGANTLRAAAIDKSGTMLHKIACAARVEEGRDAVIDGIVEAITSLRGYYSTREMRGIGVASPGFIRMREGVIAGANRLPHLENIPLRDMLSDRLGAKVILENDGNAAALGERWAGAGRGTDDLVLLTIGAGIGGGIIAGGKIVRGSVGMAGEFGHISVVPNGNPCGCGNQGCLEKHASATAVGAMARMMHLGDNLTAKDIFELANQTTDPAEKARAIWRVMGEALGMALAQLVNTFNFPLYLIGGGVLPAWKYFAPHMMKVAKQRSFALRATGHETRVTQASLGDLAGLYGAAYLTWAEK
jgi:glucokinase